MPTKKTAPPPAAPEAMPESYEAAMTELEQLVRSLETGQMPLEELLAQHQRGADLLGFCRERLTQLENQVEVLKDQAEGQGPDNTA